MMLISFRELDKLARNAAQKIRECLFTPETRSDIPKVYGIPRGGINAALAIGAHLQITLVDNPNDADVIVDDLIDSGSTREKYLSTNPSTPFIVLLDKRNDPEYKGKWIVFPWEKTETQDLSVTDNIVRLLQYVGEDPTREGLLETPKRVAKAWKHWCSGYSLKAEDILKVFTDGADGCDQMVVRKDIPIYSNCEHHLCPIIGKCTIAYIPDGNIVGLSKLDRLADMFARRLQVQERMTNQIADSIWNILRPKGVGVWVSARHMCIESRGVQNHNSETVTTALRGVMLTQAETRAEFLALARS